ncbi:acyl-CoA synthetase [Mycobacterium sp. E1747]|uniref:acyl-CoA synthetase n=1 Tax=Mycobacterium sp. E1747 TaxID=1834128 RepID=UPI0007FEA3DB|nr:acyl-CoA synthetase [Mycobacterium sp. E1747]OBH08876.1 acyl-CoA synthetase [Mycobacterium sp. E1747]
MYPGAPALDQPDKAAFVMASTGAVTTYAQLDAAANRLSRVLRDAGVEPGMHVAFCLENHPRLLEVAWGCIYAGAVFTACSSRTTAQELAYLVNDCGATVFITSSALAQNAVDIIELTPRVRLRLMLDENVPGYQSYDEATAAQTPEPLANRIAGIDMFYSSGTTGKPKGVNRNFTAEPLEKGTKSARATTRLLTKLLGAGPDCVYLSPAPLYHSAPLRFCLAVTGFGGTAIIMDRFDAEDYLALVERYHVTHSQVVPTMFVRLLKLDDQTRRSYDVSSLRSVVHASAPCPVAIKKQIIEWLGPIVHEYYSGTEGNGFTFASCAEWLTHPGTVGRPLGCVIHVVGEDGSELGVGETGTVFFEGGAPFAYHNDESKTLEAQHFRGWTTIGDVGHVDADGYLFLTDRTAFTIISGGVNIYPQEAENVLITHAKVADVAVFGVPNEEFGEEVKAVVQPEVMPSTSTEASDLEAELIAFCRSQLTDLKCPRTVDFRSELPRHPTGKLHKRILKDQYWPASSTS